jgi:hypothetical protein
VKLPLPIALVALVTSFARGAAAEKPFVDHPLTLAILHMSADAGIGFGQYEGIDSAGHSTGNRVGWGANLEAAIGLPFLGEFGARFGYRFNDTGSFAQADHFARLFDPVVNEPGTDAFANPELYLRGTLFDLQVVQVGLETRVIIPAAQGSYFAVTPGVPVRIHVPKVARIDTGLYLPISFEPDTGYSIQVPAQLFFQVNDAFFGPLTGLRYTHHGGDPQPEIVAGVGGGYTLSEVLDLKVQVYTSQINDVNWSKHIGGGLGAGLRLP